MHPKLPGINPEFIQHLSQNIASQAINKATPYIICSTLDAATKITGPAAGTALQQGCGAPMAAHRKLLAAKRGFEAIIDS